MTGSASLHIRKSLKLLIIYFGALWSGVCASPRAVAETLRYPQLVDKFYTANSNNLIWTSTGSDAQRLRAELAGMLDNAAKLGLDKQKYHYQYIRGAPDVANDMEVDRVFTDAAIAMLKDIYAGNLGEELMEYDEVNSKHQQSEADYIVNKLARVQTAEQLETLAQALEPDDENYKVLKGELSQQIASGATGKVRALNVAVNYYRRVHHYKFDQYVLVNICKAMLTYYQNGVPALEMKVVVGKPTKMTPRFSAYCYEEVMYPYWNVPDDIGTGEILPDVKRNSARLRALHMEVIDNSGKAVNPATIKWADYSKNNFPYRFRQKTGCFNSLGVLKFNISDPFSVYMHDTDYKGAFKLSKRYLSHGCIRLEKPLELGDLLLPGQIDGELLKQCLTGQEPTTIKLAEPVPVFAVYMPVGVQNGQVVYYPDVYKLLAN
ncbi:MAG: L,D-transpeptidase family protein [Bacteroidetes bacterium]|nr:L,D-transpeptidase family protein [Bacteroidota bacterium]